MKDFIYIGSSPYGEPCAQVGSPDYHTRSRIECRVFADQLRRLFPPPAGGAIRILREPHDFGSYLTVVAEFDPNSEESVNWAYRIEAEGPEHWDAEAKEQLTTLSPKETL